MYKPSSISRGFSLTELLVVIAIIGLLTSIVLVSMEPARVDSRMSKRLTDMSQIQIALKLYKEKNGEYPITGWRSHCSHSTWQGVDDWIPGLSPEFIDTLPQDPQAGRGASDENCYLYRSNLSGTGYKLLIYKPTDLETSEDFTRYPDHLDPYRDGGTNQCELDGTGYYALSFYSPAGRCL